MAMATASLGEVKRRGRSLQEREDELEAERAAFASTRVRLEEEIKLQRANAAEALKGKKELEGQFAQAQEGWKVACEKSNSLLMKEREKVQALEVEKERLTSVVEEKVKEVEAEKAKAGEARAALVQKDDELVQMCARLSALELEKGGLVQEVGSLREEKAAAVADVEVLRTEKVNAESLMADAQAAQVDAQQDLDWLMTTGVPEIFQRVWNEPTLTQRIADLLKKSKLVGLKEGFAEGFDFCLGGASADKNPYQNIDAAGQLAAEMEAYESTTFSVLSIVEQCAQTPGGVKTLREAFEAAARASTGEGTSGTRHEEEEEEEEEEQLDYN